MAIKFLQEKERQEAMIYITVFVVVLTGLIYFVGVDFDFKEPDIVLEGKDNFLEIRTTLDEIKANHDLTKFRTFTLIPPFDEIPGRPNPFNADGIEVIRIVEEKPLEIEDRGNDLFESPGEGNGGLLEEIIVE